MNKALTTIALLPLMATVACSDDDGINPAEGNIVNPSEISFAPTFDRSSRSASLYDSNHTPSQFVVGAFHIDSIGNRKPFFIDDKYVKQNGQWVNTSGTRYWPDGGSTDFYAIVMDANPTDDKMSIGWNDFVQVMNPKAKSLPSPYITTYTIDSDARNQYDLMYAVAKDQHRNGQPVPLNFRHAMLQAVFNAMNVSKNIYVEVSGVSIENLNMHFSMTLPNKTTGTDAMDDRNTYATLGPVCTGYFRSPSYAKFPTVALPGNPDESVAPTPLTSANDSLTMLLTPAQSGEDAPTNPLTNPNAYATQTKYVYPYNPATALGKAGQGFKINCTIWEVKDPSKGHDPAVDVELWGDKGGTPKELIVPIDISNWQPGKRYVYTLVFGKGNAGYDPESGNPVLAPISYDVTVDNFVDVNNSQNL